MQTGQTRGELKYILNLFISLTMVILQKSKIGWIALGTGSSVWLLRLTYKPLASSSGRLSLKSVDKHQVIETQHTGSISNILLVTASKMVVTSGEDSKIKFWSFQATEKHLELSVSLSLIYNSLMS